MAHKTLIDGTAYEVSGGKTLIGGTAYNIKAGRTLVDGTGYDITLTPPPPPLQIYTIGDTSLQNGAIIDSESEYYGIYSDEILLGGSKTSRSGRFGFYLPVEAMVGYTKLFVTIYHKSSSPTQTFIGWGNGSWDSGAPKYLYVHKYFGDTSNYASNGVTKWQEVDYSGSNAMNYPDTYELDISSVAGKELFEVIIVFKRDDVTYCGIEDIHFE